LELFAHSRAIPLRRIEPTRRSYFHRSAKTDPELPGAKVNTRTFNIAQLLVDTDGVQYATSVAFRTSNDSPVWGFDVTVEIPGRGSTTRAVVLEADRPQHLCASWLSELREQLAELGGVVDVYDHSDCEVCNGEVVVTATFSDGVKLDPIDLAESLAAKGGHRVD
jgi:hypothetical protein